jgi:xanthine dehydrogenase accessory factor
MSRDVLRELSELAGRGAPCVLCTVVETRGSTPQKAGSAMLVRPDGGQAGTLGGGCVEAEVRRRALHLLAADAGPSVATFTLDDNHGWDDGLICGGRMTVLLDPVRPSDSAAAPYFAARRAVLERGTGHVEAVPFGPDAGTPVGGRWLFDAEGRPLAARTADPIPPHVMDQARVAPERPRPSAQRGVAYLPTASRVRLLVVGGGHVGQAVARLAAAVDFEPWVLDDRERYASAERFPEATRRIVGPIGPELARLAAAGEFTPRTYAVILTRGHAHDEEALAHLADTPLGYVGMIGSRRKVRLIFEDLLARGVPAAALARIRAPLGLDIGSQTVPEIAVSVVAELIASRNRGSVEVPLRAAVAPSLGEDDAKG